MRSDYHTEILDQIRQKSGKATKHTFLENYLGNDHPRYAINGPTMRLIAKDFMRSHRDITAREVQSLVTSMVKGESYNEKVMAGAILDYTTRPQRKFDPAIFDRWLNHLQGWAEVDSLCTGVFTITELTTNWPAWKKLLIIFSKSTNIHKRRASLVLLCSPVRYCTEKSMCTLALANIEKLKKEKDILITKAISWLLRSMIKNYKAEVKNYLAENASSLPAIAVRETKIKLATGRKTQPKK